ncbi:hypothetical protein OO007_06745 [Cocleimonas sp. KMM 6892]|uniref:hypothetical protein n=1 Tax=unclassified Cocleimonas TaxID=2639732 RepID=UPI002DBD3472|nr:MULTISPECIES: hypothetical protein [unclassified Cocleimonas]MEB8431921.1 hypothetical protein [Cocleimonas sp. KMM 6892]MEC4714993.1 hypothetical protein [Cocleimonas sp. KMM 6895]MEC4744193.1 hypothetical protein [Cocleimonas sp. KMM 6896]
MGYNLYITRKENHWDESGSKISKKEWLEYVSKDSELIIDSKSKDYVILKNSGDSAPWLFWSETGVIDSKNPPHFFIEKMISIATDMDAKVQGDDLEIYTSIPNGYKLITDAQPPVVIEYHRKAMNGKVEYTEILTSNNKPTATLQNKEKASVNTFSLLLLLLVVLAVGYFVISRLIK